MKKKSLLITVIAILGFVTITLAQTVPSYVPTSGLVGWWPFTGNANDSSGNGYNGTPLNGTMLISDRTGSLNSAFSFDGTDDLIQTTLPYSDLIGAKALSISAWINLGSISSFWGYSIITNHFPGSSQFAFALGGTNDGTNHRKLVFFFNSFSGGSQAIYCPVRAININEWTHVACSVKSDTVKFYVNGTQIYGQSVGFDSLSTEGPAPNVKIGQGNPTTGFRQDWNGYLDDIGIWNRALDSCEIKDLYFARPGSCCHISVSTQPVSQSANISNTAQFTIASSDSSATYQWQSDLGIGFQNINSVGQYSGTTNDTLSVSSVTMGNNNQPFRCIIRSGSCYDTSDIAILNVCGAVTTSPANQNVVINNTAQFTTASTDPMATYQWQSDLGVGFRNLNSVGQYSGTNKDTLRVANVTMGNNNQPFRCIVSSGPCSDTSSAVVLTVINVNGINETATNNLFTVYPNPAKSQINVKVDATLIGASYAIYDNIGKVILTGKINAENTVIELGSLSGGIYLFNIGDNLKQMFTVVKE
jgi:Concanavalin A-like lectin/glucanases superfamily/Secretion system C-terminal sorting domain